MFENIKNKKTPIGVDLVNAGFEIVDNRMKALTYKDFYDILKCNC